MRITLITLYLLGSLVILAACTQEQPPRAEVVAATVAPPTLVAAPTAVPTTPPAATAIPATPAPIDAPAQPAPTTAPLPELDHHRGPSPYGAQFPEFEVVYDPALWEFVYDNGTGRQDQLVNRQDPTCVVWLQAGPIGMTPRGEEALGVHTWQVGGDHMAALDAYVALYSLRLDDGGYVIGVIFPNGEEYRAADKGTCQRLAEEVIATVEVVEG